MAMYSRGINLLGGDYMSKYIKKPIPIEAIQWHGGNEEEIRAFAGKNVKFVKHFGTADRPETACPPHRKRRWRARRPPDYRTGVSGTQGKRQGHAP